MTPEANLEDFTETQNTSVLESIARTQNQLRRALDFGSKYIDYKMGLAGAAVMSGIVFGINYQDANEVLGATTAAAKQGAYSLLFGGAIMRGCERLATEIKNKGLALASAVIIPSAVSLGLTYGVHSMKGTPKPFESTIPTAVFVIPATAVWGHRKRKQYMDINEIKKDCTEA